MTISVFRVTFIAILLLQCCSAFAQEPIKVLLAKGGGLVSSIQVRNAMLRANDILDNTFDERPNGTYRFESAAVQAGAPQVFTAACPSGLDAKDTALCAIAELADERDQFDADIVVMVVENIQGDCGGVRPEMINAWSISALNSIFAYAVIDTECLNTTVRNREGFAHEVGHLLSLEHHDHDPDLDKPARVTIPQPIEDITYNHAEEAGVSGGWNLTVMASMGDCGPIGCLNGTWFPFYSEDGKKFPGGADAGDATHSDAKRVIEDISWDVVAAYRPIPTTSLPVCTIEPISCRNEMVTFTSNGIGSPAMAQRKVGEGGVWEDLGNVLGSLCIPASIQHATRNFFRMISIHGQELCEIEIVLYDECGEDPHELW